VTDRHAGYFVTLERDIREDDAEVTIAALQRIKGVLRVEPLVASAELAIAENRARQEIIKRIYELADSLSGRAVPK
jgi:hypothetical protein